MFNICVLNSLCASFADRRMYMYSHATCANQLKGIVKKKKSL